MKPSRENCRSSRIAVYVLILGSLLAACNVGIQPVSSLLVDTSTTSTQTSTQTNTATYFTVAVATSNLVVTVLTVQYTTATSLFTVQDVQFTTLTSFVTHNQVEQPTGESAPAYHPTQQSENALQYNAGLVSHSPRSEDNSEYNVGNSGVQLITLLATISGLAFLIRRKN